MKPIHPFPARMAPEIVGAVIGALRSSHRIIDPMCGSGTVLRQAVEAGLDCVGYDIDPVSVLMASGWTSPVPQHQLLHDASLVVDQAKGLRRTQVDLPWSDEFTDKFARYWFAEPQFGALTRLAHVL